uniref:Src kinase-associated phosphoprotein 1 n=1 Tax=Lygus hesperus TaxID=30085 RepID=A0A0A9XFV4_LYGHE
MNKKARSSVKSFFENAQPSLSEFCALVRSHVMFMSSPNITEDPSGISGAGSSSGGGSAIISSEEEALGTGEILKDIQELRLYLGETLAREKLAPAVEEQRLRLLAKLNQISPPQATYCSPVGYCTPPGYLDMTRAATLPSLTNIGKEIMTYQTVSEQGTSSTSTVTKSGRLGRRERFLWMGQTRKWWAVLSPSAVLTLYSGPNETRALSTICLENYQARPASQGKSSGVFELFSPGNKTYQFIASDSEDMDSWIAAFNDVCSKRRLPSPPSPPPMPPNSELYDTPASHARPVTPTKQEYETMDASFYHVIADSKFRPQEQLYKNIGPHDENCYYNLLPRCTTEEIYQTIMEAEKAAPGAGQNRIQAIIKAMEAKVAEAQLYEPVETGHELDR